MSEHATMARQGAAASRDPANAATVISRCTRRAHAACWLI